MYDFKTFTFGRGSHSSRDAGMCVMEAVAYVASEPHSDHPKCACPVLSAFLRSWNDGITDDKRRTELLEPFVFRLVGTKATPEIELRRSWMCFDWLVRDCLPRALSLVPSLQSHAAVLRGLPEITADNFDMAVAALNPAASAASAAWDARVASAAWAASAASVASAARVASAASAARVAWVASSASAAMAARAASAAWAAWDASAASAASAAWDARVASAAWDTRVALETCVRECQDSAALLVDRMIRLTEPQEAGVANRVESVSL